MGDPATKPLPCAGVTVSAVSAPELGSTPKLRLPTPGSVTVNVPADCVTVGRAAGAIDGESSAKAAAGIPAKPRPRADAEPAKMSLRTIMAQGLPCGERLYKSSIVRSRSLSHMGGTTSGVPHG